MRFDELAERWIIDMKGTVSCRTIMRMYRRLSDVWNGIKPYLSDFGI